MKDNKKNLITAISSGLIVVCVAVTISLTHAATNSPTDAESVETTATSQTLAEVQITADGLLPSTVAVPPGTPVSWVNQDGKTHVLTFTPLNSADTSPEIETDQSYSNTFTEIGTYEYSIDPDGPVVGTVVVQ